MEESVNPETIEIIILISSILSLCGAFFIVISFIIFEESRRCGRRILLCMSIADIGLSFSWLMTMLPSVANAIDNKTSVACHFQAYIFQFFRLSSYLWTGCFAFHLYQIIWKGNRTPEIYESRYHMLSWGVPFSVILHFIIQGLAGYDLLGHTGRPWCWIRSWDGGNWSVDGFVLQLLFFYIPTLSVLVFNIVIYTFLSQKLNQLMSSRLESKVRRRMLTYIMIFLLTFLFDFLGRLYQTVSKSHHYNSVLLILNAIFAPLQGFFHSASYGFNQSLRERYSSWLEKRKENSLSNAAKPMLSSHPTSIISEG